MPGHRSRILVVDDSPVITHLVANVISSDPDLSAAGFAHSGDIVMNKINLLNPDLVLLDIELPGINGLDVLSLIREKHPRLPIIIFTAMGEGSVKTSLEALSRGASEFVIKPSNLNLDSAQDHLKKQLLPKIKELCGKAEISSSPTTQTPLDRNPSVISLASPRSGPIEVVAIGVSTGGPNALAEIIPRLPAKFPYPILIVQHMPPVFTKLLAERLSANAELKVKEAAAGEDVQKGWVYIAPGNHHMEIQRRGDKVVIVTHQGPLVNSCRPAVDPLFRSVADAYGSKVLGIILTGMGSDGLNGCEYLYGKGGRIFVQDKDSSVVWAMPGCVAQAGLAEKIISISQMAQEITRAAERLP